MHLKFGYPSYRHTYLRQPRIPLVVVCFLLNRKTVISICHRVTIINIKYHVETCVAKIPYLILLMYRKLTSGGRPDGRSEGTGASGDAGLRAMTGDKGAAGGGDATADVIGRCGGVGGTGGVDGLRATTCCGRGPAFLLGGTARGLSDPLLPPAPPLPLPRTAPSGSMSASSTIILCKYTHTNFTMGSLLLYYDTRWRFVAIL